MPVPEIVDAVRLRGYDAREQPLRPKP